MTQQPKTSRIPAPLYAAAGVGELAYQQLRKLPTVMGELSGRAVAGGLELRERAAATLKVANTTAAVLREKATATDLERLRESARQGTLSFAQAAQERATAVYTALVAHGERVVGAGVVQAADTVNADMEATEAPKAVTGTPAEVAEKTSAAKPRKRATTAK